MTKEKLLDVLSSHGWEIKGKTSAAKAESSVSIFCDFGSDMKNLACRLLFSGNGIQFNAPFASIEITGNWLKAEWENNRVEVRI